jgi:hypothetical protein
MSTNLHSPQSQKIRSSAMTLVSRALTTASLLGISVSAAWCQTNVSVSVNASATTATVGPEAYGVDTAVYDNYLTSSGVATELKDGGIGAIRYPGGSYADIFNFISGTDQTLNGGYFAPGDTFNNFMNDVVLPEGGKAVITVNYGSNIGATGGGQPSEAASWVQYANVTNNYGIVYWEIGNEVYGNGYYSTSLDWEEDLHDTNTNASARVGNSALSPTAYGTNAAAFIKAMKAVDPNIKCGVFVNTASYYTNWDQDVLTAVSNALEGSGYTLDFVILHYYPGGSNAQVLASNATIASTVAQVRSDIKNYYKLSNGSSIQIAVTESGSGSAGGLFPFLFAADEYLTWIENNTANIEYQELHNGFLDSSNTPLGPWYGASFDSTIARPGDATVTATSNNALLRAHAVSRTDGKVGIVLINDNPNESANVTVNVSGANLSTTGTRYQFGNANYTGGSSYANSGIEESSISGVGNSFTISVPAYTETAVVIPATGVVSNSPTITSLSPTSGVAGSSVTISGTNLGASQGASTVSFGGTHASITAWSSTSITATVPSLGAGAVSVTVSVAGVTSNAMSFTVTTTTGTNLIANGTYTITNRNSGQAVDVTGASKTEGTYVEQWDSTGGTNQKWELTNLGNNYVELINENSGYALDVYGASTANDGLIDQWPYDSGKNQIWHVVSEGSGYYELINENSGLALEVPSYSTTEGTKLDQYTPNGGTNQLWSFN